MANETPSGKLPEVVSGEWEDGREKVTESELTVHEAKFIEGLGKFGIESKALEFAGYTPDSKNAWRLKQRPRVKFAIERMKSQALERAVMGRVELIEQSKELLKESRAAKQYTAARGINQDLAVLCGIGLRGELEESGDSENSFDVSEAISQANFRIGEGYAAWERRESQRVIEEYRKLTGVEITFGRFDESLEALKVSSGKELATTCKGCGRPF